MKKNPVDYWGQHLVANAKMCDMLKVRDPDYISSFIQHLVREIDMTPYGAPQLVHFADNTDKAGWTAIQLIETSNIIAHFLDGNGDLYLDVFSCKPFEPLIVVNALVEYFSPKKIVHTNIFRDATAGIKVEFSNEYKSTTSFQKAQDPSEEWD
jgi:S-adenosylmethionine/arginine decarboxylase-like enzyme